MRPLYFALCCLFMSVFQPCRQIHAQVVGGSPELSGADFFCSLVDPQTGAIEPLCGASLIAPQWVLTAGHCGLSQATLQVMDSVDVVIHPYVRTNTSAYLRYRADKIYVHRGFDINGSLEHDIALIKLRTAVSSPVTVELPQQGSNAYTQPGNTVYVTGYGIYDLNQMWAQPDTLQIGTIRIIANDTCNEPARYNNTIAPTMICAGLLTGSPRGGAAGDSGGPLFAATANGPVQVGIVSWGYQAYSDATHPGVYTRVSSYRRWIDSVMGTNNPAAVPPVQVLPPRIIVGRDMITVQFQEPHKAPIHYSVYTVDGRVLAQGTFSGRPIFQMPLPQRAASLYFLKLADGQGLNHTSRIALLQ